MKVIDYPTLIRTRRKKLKMSQTELANKACVNRCTVSTIEIGKTLGMTDVFLSILDALGLRVDIVEVDHDS